jgi:hypothetical protein
MHSHYSRCAAMDDTARHSIHEEMLIVHEFVPFKVVQTNRWRNDRRRSKAAYDGRPGEEVAETTVKKLLCCGFPRAGKAMGQVYQCW